MQKRISFIMLLLSVAILFCSCGYQMVVTTNGVAGESDSDQPSSADEIGKTELVPEKPAAVKSQPIFLNPEFPDWEEGDCYPAYMEINARYRMVVDDYNYWLYDTTQQQKALISNDGVPFRFITGEKSFALIHGTEIYLLDEEFGLLPNQPQLPANQDGQNILPYGVAQKQGGDYYICCAVYPENAAPGRGVFYLYHYDANGQMIEELSTEISPQVDWRDLESPVCAYRFTGDLLTMEAQDGLLYDISSGDVQQVSGRAYFVENGIAFVTDDRIQYYRDGHRILDAAIDLGENITPVIFDEQFPESSNAIEEVGMQPDGSALFIRQPMQITYAYLDTGQVHTEPSFPDEEGEPVDRSADGKYEIHATFYAIEGWGDRPTAYGYYILNTQTAERHYMDVYYRWRFEDHGFCADRYYIGTNNAFYDLQTGNKLSFKLEGIEYAQSFAFLPQKNYYATANFMSVPEYGEQYTGVEVNIFDPNGKLLRSIEVPDAVGFPDANWRYPAHIILEVDGDNLLLDSLGSTSYRIDPDTGSIQEIAKEENGVK